MKEPKKKMKIVAIIGSLHERGASQGYAPTWGASLQTQKKKWGAARGPTPDPYDVLASWVELP